MSDFRTSRSIRIIRQIVRFALPIILLTIIFLRVDLGKLAENFRNINFAYLAVVLVLVVISQLLFGALRWKIILKNLYQIDLPYLAALRYMWMGLFVGYFIPAGLGIDIYRTYRAAKHGGGYGKNIGAIIGEKIYAAVASVLLILACYILIRDMITADPGVLRIIKISFFAGCALALLGIAVFIATGTGRGQSILSFISRWFESMISRVVSKITGKDKNNGQEKEYTSNLIKPLFNWKILLLAVGITIVMRIVTGVGNNVLYKALGVELPVIVNIFVSSLLFYIFVLPISFGTLGVREGGNILLYGLFGVEAETALTASFLGLGCVLVAIFIGGIILLLDNMASGKTRKEGG